MKLGKDIKSNNAGSEIQIKYKWSLREIAGHGNVDIVAIQDILAMDPKELR